MMEFLSQQKAELNFKNRGRERSGNVEQGLIDLSRDSARIRASAAELMERRTSGRL
jgi:hypothetical protein